MENKLRILIAGGDMRQIYCAGRLSQEYDTAVIGFDEKYFSDNSESAKSVLSDGEPFDCAVLPVPPLDDEGMLSTPCYTEKIDPYTIKKLLRPDGIVFTGKSDERLTEIFTGMEICDYMKREELSLKNAIPSAEGAVQLALEELPVTLNGLKVLIVGMGRIGTALTEILKGFGSDITVAVRNARGAANARIHGVKSVRTDKIDTDYELVFNTVPSLVFESELLNRFSDKTLFIDLASKPGGIDFDSAAKFGKKVVWALGLPGKTAPVTSGEIIAETVSDILEERSERYDV